MAQDYIMRLVEQIAAMLAAMIVKRNSGRIEEARQDLATISLETIGLTLETVKSLSPEAVAGQLETAGANRFPRSVMLAELLIQDAEMLEAEGHDDKAAPAYIHAFCLLADAFPFLTDVEQLHYRPKLGMLTSRVEQLPPNPYTSGRLRVLAL